MGGKPHTGELDSINLLVIHFRTYGSMACYLLVWHVIWHVICSSNSLVWGHVGLSTMGACTCVVINVTIIQISVSKQYLVPLHCEVRVEVEDDEQS